MAASQLPKRHARQTVGNGNWTAAAANHAGTSITISGVSNDYSYVVGACAWPDTVRWYNVYGSDGDTVYHTIPGLQNGVKYGVALRAHNQFVPGPRVGACTAPPPSNSSCARARPARGRLCNPRRRRQAAALRAAGVTPGGGSISRASTRKTGWCAATPDSTGLFLGRSSVTLPKRTPMRAWRLLCPGRAGRSIALLPLRPVVQAGKEPARPPCKTARSCAARMRTSTPSGLSANIS